MVFPTNESPFPPMCSPPMFVSQNSVPNPSETSIESNRTNEARRHLLVLSLFLSFLYFNMSMIIVSPPPLLFFFLVLLLIQPQLLLLLLLLLLLPQPLTGYQATNHYPVWARQSIFVRHPKKNLRSLVGSRGKMSHLHIFFFSLHHISLQKLVRLAMGGDIFSHRVFGQALCMRLRKKDCLTHYIALHSMCLYVSSPSNRHSQKRRLQIP